MRITKSKLKQIFKEEYNHLLAEQYTAAAEYDPLLDPHGVDLGIEQSMFGAEGPEVIDYNQPPDLRQVHNVVPVDRGQPHSEWMDEWLFNKERKKAVLDDILFQVLDTMRKENPSLFDSPEQKKLPYVHHLNEGPIPDPVQRNAAPGPWNARASMQLDPDIIHYLQSHPEEDIYLTPAEVDALPLQGGHQSHGGPADAVTPTSMEEIEAMEKDIASMPDMTPEEFERFQKALFDPERTSALTLPLLGDIPGFETEPSWWDQPEPIDQDEAATDELARAEDPDIDQPDYKWFGEEDLEYDRNQNAYDFKLDTEVIIDKTNTMRSRWVLPKHVHPLVDQKGNVWGLYNEVSGYTYGLPERRLTNYAREQIVKDGVAYKF